jgi:Tfp pilus assembly protein PilF
VGHGATEAEQFNAAVAELEAAHRTDPTNFTVIKALGLAYAWNGEVEQAAVMLIDVPGIVEELNTWGWWWGSHDEIDQARYAYQVSLLLDADQPEVREALDNLIHQP